MIKKKSFWFKAMCLVLVLSLATPMFAIAQPSAAEIDYNRASCYTAEEGNIARLPFMLQLTNDTNARYNPNTGAGVDRTGINANFCNDSYGVPSVQVLRLNNGLRPAAGTSNGYLSWAYTDTFGVNNRLYFVLNWGEPYTIDSVRCDWWTDSNVSVPNSEARVEWLDGTVWREVTNMRNPVTGAAVTNIGTLAMGNWNPVTFDPVTTTQLRLRLFRTGTITNGIGVGEWEVFGVKAGSETCPDCGEDPCVCEPVTVMTQREFIKSLLISTGMAEHQFANGPAGDEFFNYSEMARVAGFFDNWNYEPAKVLTPAESVQMTNAVTPAYNALLNALQADPPAPYFVNGLAVPIFPYGNSPTAKYNDTTGEGIARYVVYIDTNYDSDGDGKLDYVKVLVQLPRAAVEKGMKVSTIYEARPYIEGTNGSVHTTATLNGWGNAWLAANGPFTHEMLHRVAPPRVPTGEATTKEMVQNADFRDWYYTYTYTQSSTSAAVSYTGTSQNVYENLNWYDYYLVRGFAVVSSAGLAALNSTGISTYGADIEIDAFKCVIEWLTGDRKAYSDKAGTIEVKADWSNGNIGMTGRSYAGGTQFALATTGVKGLKAVVPVAGTASYYDYQNSGGGLTGSNTYTQGMAWYINSRLGAPDWLSVRDIQAGYIQQMLAEATALNGNYGDHWARREYTVDGWFKDWGPSKIQTPMLVVHGLNDDNVRAKQSINMYNAAVHAGVPVKMLWNQGEHMTPTFPLGTPTAAEAITGTMRPHGMYVGTFELNGKEVELQYDDVLNLWFSHYLYGVDNKVLDVLPGVIAQDNDIVPVGNGANVWVHYDSWEPFTTRYLTGKHNVSANLATAGMGIFDTGRIAPEYVLPEAIPPEAEAAQAEGEITVPDALTPGAAIVAAAAAEPQIVTLSSASAATLSLANLRTPTAGSIIYAIDLPQDFTVKGVVEVNIRAAFNTLGTTTATDNLRMHVTLAEVPLTANTLRYYGAANVGTAPGRTMVSQRGAYQGSGVTNINLVRFTQVTNGSYRQIAKGWFDLCNPEAGFEAYKSAIEDRIVPRDNIGIFHDYTVFLQPAIHTAKQGNKLVALITFGVSSPASTTGNAAYTVNVDLGGTYVALPSAYEANLVGEPSFIEPDPATVTFDYQIAGVEPTVVQTTVNSEFGTLPVPPANPGFRFMGWFTAKAGGDAITPTTIVTQEAVTVYAQWRVELVGKPGRFLSDPEIFKRYVVDSPYAHTYASENAETLFEHGPGTAYGLIKTYAGTEFYGKPGFEAVDADGFVVDPYFEKGGFMKVPMSKPSLHFYSIMMDFEDCVGDFYAPYGLQSSVVTSGGAVYDLTYPQVLFNMTYYGLGQEGVNGLANLPDHIFEGVTGTMPAVPKAVKQRVEEMSMNKVVVTPVCLNGEYARVHPFIDEVNDKWPWFRATGVMLQYATQGPADCEDYRQFARTHQEALDSAVSAFLKLKADVDDFDLSEAEKQKVKDDVDEVLANIEDIDHLYTTFPSTTHGYRSGLQGGSGLDTSFNYSDQVQTHRDNEFRHVPGIKTPGGRIIGTAIFGVKGITRSPAVAITTWMHEFGHGMGLIDDYSYGSMGTNNGETTASGAGSWGVMGSSMTSTSPDLPVWRKYRMGWLEDSEIKVILPGETWEGYIRAGSSFEGDGGTYTLDPAIKTRLVTIPKEYRTRDTFGLLGVWTNGWNPNRTAYNWYDWFTNPFVGGETNAIKSFPTFYALESRKALGLDSHMGVANQGIVVSYLANPAWETAAGAGGFKVVSGASGLRTAGTATWQDLNIGLTVEVLESGVYYDKVKVTYDPEPQREAARHVYMGQLTVSDSFVADIAGERDFTVDFDILTYGNPCTNDAASAPVAPVRVGTPLGVQGGVAGFEMLVEFDADNLEYVSAGTAPFTYIVDTALASQGFLVVTGVGDKAVDKDTILSLNFRVKTGAALGDYTVKGTITDVVLHNWRGEVIQVGGPGFNGTINGSAVGTIGNGTFGAFHSPNTLNLSSEDIKSVGGKITIGPEATYKVTGRIVCETVGPIPGTNIGVESVVTIKNSLGVELASAKSDNRGYFSIDGVPNGIGYTISASKPKYAVGNSAPFAVNGGDAAVQMAPLQRLRFTVSGTVYGMRGSEGFINSNNAANSTVIWPVNTAAVPLAGVDVYLITTADAFTVVGGPVKTDAQGQYTVTGWEVGRNYVAVAVSVAGTEYEGKYLPQITLNDPAIHSPIMGVTKPLGLIIGSKFGDNPADINYPAGVGAIGMTRNATSNLFNIFCFSVDRNYTGLNVVLTETQDVRIRMTTKSNQITYEVKKVSDDTVVANGVSLGNANGDDVVRNVPPGGPYYLVASRDGYVSACTTPFTVDGARIIFRNNVTTNYMDLVTVANGRTLSGTVVNALNGDLIADARLQHLPHNTAQGASLPVKSSAAGVFSVTTTNSAGDLTASADGYYPASFFQAAGNASDLVIKLMPGPRKVTFVDWDGRVISEQIVVCGEGAVAPANPVRANWAFAGWDKDFSFVTREMIITALYNPMIVKLAPSAYVDKLNGNQNDLTISLVETWSDGYAKTFKVTLKINNNAAGTYTVGPYKVYVDTKGNTQIRECYVVNPPKLPYLGVR